MAKNTYFLVVLALAMSEPLFSGCSSSPVHPREAGFSAGQAGWIGGGALAGAGIGAAVDKRNPVVGALVGGTSGVVAGSVASLVSGKKGVQREAEIAEEARREERARLLNKYWYEQTLSRDSERKGKGAQTEIINDPAGTYESVPYFERTRVLGESKEQATEPIRR